MHPSVGKFDLIAVAEFLFEKPVLVVNAVSDGRKVERGERIQKTCRQTAETAIAEAHVVFLVAKFLDAVPEFIQRINDVFHHARTNDVIHEKATHQKFHREIVNTADIAFRMGREGFDHPLDDLILNSLGSCNPPVPAGGGHLVSREAEF